MSMTKSEIIESASEKLGISKKESVYAVESLFEIIKDVLSKGDDVMISGFGKWSVREKRRRKGRNPKTGKEIIISGRKVVTFNCSKQLRNAFQ
jgi:integration host factor subunit alpha